MTEAFDFITELARKLEASVETAEPEAGGYSAVSWDSRKAKEGFGLVQTIAEAVLEKRPNTKHVMLKREYDIDADDYTIHRVLFW